MNIKYEQYNSDKQCWKGLACGLLAVGLMLVAVGCGGGGGISKAAGSPSGSRANATIGMDNPGSVQLRIGDDPATPNDRIVTLRLDIESIKAWSTVSQDAIDFLAEPIDIDLIHSSTITMPIANSAANPNTTYDRLDIVYSGMGVAYINCPSGIVYEEEFTFAPVPTTLTVDLAPMPIQLQTDPQIVNVNVSLPSLVNLPPSGCGSVSPPANASVKIARPMAAGASLGSNPEVKVSQKSIQDSQPEDGQIPFVNGVVTRVDTDPQTLARSFTMKTSTKAHLTFQVDENTRFEDVTLASAIGMPVEVTGSTQVDGSLHADEVELIDVANGFELLGTVGYSYEGIEMSIVAQDGLGSGMTAALIGQSVDNQVSGASYVINAGNIDLSNFVVAFDGFHVFAGQQVEVESMVPLQPDPLGSAGIAEPFMVELEQQTISGTALNFVSGTGEFDLVLPTNGSSPLVTLNPGLTSVHIYRQATTFPAISSIPDNRHVQVRGILLCSESNEGGVPCTNFIMVAGKITVNN